MRERARSPDAENRLQLRKHLSKLEEFPNRVFDGKGIAICAGGAAMFTNAYVLLHVLRRELHCKLPIEVWHFGSREMSARMRFLLRELDADPVDANPIIETQQLTIGDGWQLKSLALMQSRFEQVLLLDADQVPERDPELTFSWPEFAETGAVLWPDICALEESNPIWEACGLAKQRTRAIESGQILVDKSRHWAALQIALFLNKRADHYYEMVYGDKDLFLMAFLLSGKPFSIVPHLPFSDQPWCLFQRDFAGERLFQHRTGAKWTYREPQTEVASFCHESACRSALEVLRKKWNGHVFTPPVRSSEAMREEARLVASCKFQLAEPGKEPRLTELLPFNEIGAGRSHKYLNWFCEGTEELALVFADQFGERLRLWKSSGGRWVESENREAPILFSAAEIESAPNDSGPQSRFPWNPAQRYIFDY
jgi:hypothetical protein